MAWAFVQSAHQRTVGANAKAFGTNNTAGNLIVVAIELEHNTDTIASVVDTRNTYAIAGVLQASGGSGYQTAIYYAKNIGAGANTVTVTPTTGTTPVNIAIHEYSGLDTVSPLDQTASATGVSAAPSSGSATTTAANELIFGTISSNAAVTLTGGLTSREDFTFNQFSYSADKNGAAAGSYSVTGTIVANAWVAAMATFKEPTVSGSMTYAQLLASTSPDFVVLAEPQPMEPLASWTAAGGGLTNTYYCTFASVVGTAPNTIYRRLDEVRQNTTLLTSRASAALVNSNLGSYYHDTANNRLYISTTTGVVPDTFALIGAWFTLPLCDGGAPLAFSDQSLYYPLLTGTLPSFVSEKPDPLFGATISDTGELSLLNGDGLFDTLAKRWVWRNKTVTFKLGGASLAYSEFATIGVMRINAIQADDEVCTLQLEMMGSILNKSLARRTWGDGTLITYTGAFEGVLGSAQPILLGVAYDIMAAYVGATGGVDYYGFLDESVQFGTVLSVYAIARATGVRTTLTPSVDWATYSGGIFRVLNVVYSSTLYEIRADVIDVSTSACTFGAITQSLLLLAGEDSGNINAASFAAVDAAYPDKQMGVYIPDTERSAADVLRQLERSINGQVYIAADGRWTCRVWSASGPAAYTLTEADFASWKVSGTLQSALDEVRVTRVTSWATGDTSEVSSSSAAIQYANETRDSVTVNSLLLSDVQTAILANHLRFLRGTPPTLIEFEERGLTLMGASVGDLVSVTRSRAPDARTGAYASHLLMIEKIEKHLGPDCPRVAGVLNDLEAQTARIFRLSGSGSTTLWSAATEAERSVYGFLSDSSGYLDATDPRTYKGKVLR